MVYRKLPKNQEEDLFVSLCRAAASVNDPVEASHLIKDLLTDCETRNISKRLEIARLLMDGLGYDEIAQILKVSHPTIAKVSLWLQISGEGFRLVLQRTKDRPKVKVAKESWGYLKRRYPQYFWPQVLLEELVTSANRKELERIKQVMGKLKEKSELIRRIDGLVSGQLRTRNHV